MTRQNEEREGANAMAVVKFALRQVLVLVLAGSAIAAASREPGIIVAAKNADAAALRELVKQGANVSVSQADGTTALHWAAYRDDLESVNLLLVAGANVNAVNQLGVTPLWTACENGSAAMVQKLLQAGANPNVALASGETPLMTAARTGNADVVRQLLAKGADVNAKESARGQTALMWAVAQRHAKVVGALLASGADVHARSNVWTQVVKMTTEAKNAPYITDIQQGGYTPLLFAARVGDLPSAKLLVEARADVNVTAPYGTTALVVAAHGGHGEVAEFLLEKGADPNMDGAGYTALHIAIRRNDAKLVRALLARKANPEALLLKPTPARRGSNDVYLAPSFVGASPFWLAARYGAPKIMSLLAEHGANARFVHHLAFWAQAEGYELGRVIEGNTTALMAAVGMGDDLRPPDEATTLEAVRVAVGLKVDVNAANALGETALHAAAARGYDSVVKFLLENGARSDVRNTRGQTPLSAIVSNPARRSTADLLRMLDVKQ
jgi:ankyrin repeat protein